MNRKFFLITFLSIFVILLGISCTQRDTTPLTTQTAVPQPTPSADIPPTPSLAPTILVEPVTALADEPVSIQVVGLTPGQTITLTASMRDDFDRLWKSEATFVADARGAVDVQTQAPISGSYTESDPMGLFWSMEPSTSGRNEFFGNWEITPVIITLTAEFGDEKIGPFYLTRTRLADGVERTFVMDNGLRGIYFAPQTPERVPALIVLGGSGGGIDSSKAAMLASHGYATLALEYFGNPPLPTSLTEVALEYFETAVNWLKTQDIVDENRIGVIGTSRGGELALLLGATYPELFQAVVGYAPSGLVFGEYSSDVSSEKPAWTLAGEPVPYFLQEENNVGEATIPVENIQGSILLISGKDDQLWPASELSEIAINRLTEHNHPYPYDHLAYENAGHWIGVPHWPTSGRDSFVHPVSGETYSPGGTPEADAFASADSWAKLLSFLERSFE